ncbi:MAG: hypothetical protein IJA80_07345 [Clostridia bacterium]|nr:hypothetical protein [Clostridia bacterium]
MKKTYIKPQIAYESFQLSTSIASSCALLGSQQAQYVCPVTDPDTGFSIFTELCDVVPANGMTPCYDVPSENWMVFSS